MLNVEMNERVVYTREVQSRMYSPAAFLVSKSLTRIPFELLFTFLFR